MRLRHIAQAVPTITDLDVVYQEVAACCLAGQWRAQFAHKEAPLCLEIGMGRGGFAFAMAFRHPECNYLALEIRPEMIYTALERHGQPPDNLRFLWCDATRLSEIIGNGELAKIYINFPDPWPKKRHAKRRLVHPKFLALYRQALSAEGELLFKTDQANLYQEALLHLTTGQWRVLCAEENAPTMADDIMTEYEFRYRRQGVPIYAIVAKPPLI